MARSTDSDANCPVYSSIYHFNRIPEYDSATVGQRAPAAVPGFETVTAIFGLLFATAIAVALKRMR